MTTPCPACGKEAHYVKQLDRYAHDDGSANDACWRHITRGGRPSPVATQPANDPGAGDDPVLAAATVTAQLVGNAVYRAYTAAYDTAAAACDVERHDAEATATQAGLAAAITQRISEMVADGTLAGIPCTLCPGAPIFTPTDLAEHLRYEHRVVHNHCLLCGIHIDGCDCPRDVVSLVRHDARRAVTAIAPKPGDKVAIGTGDDLDVEQATDMRTRLLEHFPGVEFTIIIGATDLVIHQ